MRKILGNKEYDTDKATIIVENKNYHVPHKGIRMNYAVIFKTLNNSYFLYVRENFDDDMSRKDIEELPSVDIAIDIIYEWAKYNHIDSDATRKALEALGQTIEDA